MRLVCAGFLTIIAAVACDRAKDQHADTARAVAPLSEQQAAKETEIDGLRFVDPETRGPRLTSLGIQIGYVESTTFPGGGRYMCGGMSAEESRSAGAVIETALSRLPDDALKRLHVRYLILCSQTTANGRRIGGIPVPPLDLLMVAVGTSRKNNAYLPHLFLHELYHLIEYRFNTYQDREWDRRFSGYSNDYGSATGVRIASGRPGFLNSYAETFPHEDRAELFASLVLEPDAVATHIKATNDQVLREKALYLADKCSRLLGVALPVAGL